MYAYKVGLASVCTCNQFFFPDSTAANCSPCHVTCYQCAGGEYTDCLACFPPAQLASNTGTGLCDCPDGYYPAPTTKTCGLCHISCRKCVGVGALDCTDCYENATVDSGFPVYRCICAFGFYPNPSQIPVSSAMKPARAV